MRCMAASSAEIEPWRSSSEPRTWRSCASRSPSRDFDQAQLGLALLDQLCRFHQSAVDALALGGEFVHLRLQLLGAPLRGLQAAAIVFQLFAGLLGVAGGLRAGKRGQQQGADGHQASTAKQSRSKPHEPVRPLADRNARTPARGEFDVI